MRKLARYPSGFIRVPGLKIEFISPDVEKSS
jgi:hypothetical protein